MADEDVVAASARERRAVADLLEGLDEQSLETPSLCAGWTVRVVAGHLVSAVSAPPSAFLRCLLRARLHPHRANDLLARDTASQSPAELAALLRRHADSAFGPPVVGPRGPLTDALVHAGDMRVPLGLPHDPDPRGVRLALDFLAHGHPVGFVRRGSLRGVRLVAEDLDVSHGEGAEVRGRGIDVLMAACGRTALLPALSGPGVALLGERLTA